MSARRHPTKDTAMSISLRPGLSFCTVGGRTIFLDRASGRYFALPPAVELGFNALVGDPGSAVEDASHDLVERNILVTSGVASPIEPCAATAPTRSITGERIRVDARLVARAASLFLRVTLKLRFRGIDATLRDLSARLTGEPRTAVDHAFLARAARAFALIGLVFSPEDRCLPRGLALAALLREHGVAARIIIGVADDPFRAHCWVQLDDVVLGDSLDQVIDYTPVHSC